MMPENRYTTEVFSATNTPFDLRLQYGTLRYDSFSPDDPFLNLNHENKVEFDKFDDRDSTLYVMVWAEGTQETPRQLTAATRLIPTVLEYDIEAPSWGYITDGIELPKSENIYEYSRGVSIRRPRNAHAASMGLMGMELYELSQRLGVEKFLGVGATGHLNYIRESGITVTSLSAPISTARDKGTLELYTQDVDEVFRNNCYLMHKFAIEEAANDQGRLQEASAS